MIPNFRFLAVKNLTAYELIKSDGVIGLSYDEIDDDEEIHFVHELYDNGAIDKKVFTLFLGFNNSEREEQSKIWFGQDIVKSEYETNWIPVLEGSKNWDVEMTGLILGSQKH